MALTTACTEQLKAPAPSTGTSYVLVHGAWHGGWCWSFVKAALEAEGHTVLTPTLAGLGNRANELSAEIGLGTHIDDIVEVIAPIDAEKVVLVGHSYGGMVITGAADRLPGRISQLVYLDAAVPMDGQSMVTAGPELPEEAQAGAVAGLRALSTDDGLSMQPLPAAAFGIPPDHEHYAWTEGQLTPHPFKTWLDPISLSSDLASLPKTYIHCVAPVLQPSSMPYFAAQAEASPDWRYHELQTGHDAMITAADDVSAILLGVEAKR